MKVIILLWRISSSCHVIVMV